MYQYSTLIGSTSLTASEPANRLPLTQFIDIETDRRLKYDATKGPVRKSFLLYTTNPDSSCDHRLVQVDFLRIKTFTLEVIQPVNHELDSHL